MQRIQQIIFLLLLTSGVMSVNAQTGNPRTVDSYHFQVGYNKTTNILFPYSIKSVDIGNEQVIAQIGKGVENILQVKAARQGFPQTNVSVVTADGRFYSFLVDYAPDPAFINYRFDKDCLLPGPVAVKGEAMDEATYDALALEIKGKRKFLHKAITSEQVQFSLSGIYLTGGMMFWSMRIANRSEVDFTPAYIRFFIKDRKRGKRTASQENEMIPLFSNTHDKVAGASSTGYVFAFPAFTIPRTKELIIQVGEQNGGRSLDFKISHQTILRARKLR